ncbi:MAG: AAA family ATPase, partial [Desulfobacterales bacterium]|nr:AAA family ATPase [Desulfobacterales bacterium]
AGKSSILQAVCLALLGYKAAQELGVELLNRMRRRADGRTRNAKIGVWLEEGEKTHFVELMLTEDGTAAAGGSGMYDREMRKSWDEMKKKVILSYGATRNLTLRRDRRHENLSSRVRRQITLFDPLAQLASAEALMLEHSENGPFLNLFQELLRRVFEREIGFDIMGGRIRFTVEEEPVEAIDLPDGFRSSVAWLADLCDIWCKKFPDVAGNGAPGDIEAIILIDEIDLHLHPSLQRTLVPRLREALPRVQWIATTHSPLVLSSFDSSEIVALDRGEPDGQRRLDRQILGFTTDQIYNWLMETPATSAAMEARLREADDSEASDEEIARLLEMSPDVDEAEARDRVRRLASRLDKLKP